MEIGYSACVIKLPDEKDSRERPLVLCGQPTFDESVKDVRKMAVYYVNECHYQVRMEIETFCPICNDNGKIWKSTSKRNKFKGKWIPCPNCKGHFEKTLTVIQPE